MALLIQKESSVKACHPVSLPYRRRVIEGLTIREARHAPSQPLVPKIKRADEVTKALIEESWLLHVDKVSARIEFFIAEISIQKHHLLHIIGVYSAVLCTNDQGRQRN